MITITTLNIKVREALLNASDSVLAAIGEKIGSGIQAQSVRAAVKRNSTKLLQEHIQNEIKKQLNIPIDESITQITSIPDGYLYQ